MRQDFIPVNTFPSPVLAASGSEGLISARNCEIPNSKIQNPDSKFQNFKFQKCWVFLTLLLGFEIFRFGICKLSFAGAPHCVINKYYKNYWTNLSDFMEKQK
jgi:hypothetical protein